MTFAAATAVKHVALRVAPGARPPEHVRIDMFETRQGVTVVKFAPGWTASTPAASQEINRNTSLDEMIAWFEAHSDVWRMRAWPGGGKGNRGARAWFLKEQPVRSRDGILYYRQLFSDPRQKYRTAADPRPVSQIDFAYEY